LGSISNHTTKNMLRHDAIGTTSNVVKVRGEVPDTPGNLRGDRVRRDVGDFNYGCTPRCSLEETLGQLRFPNIGLIE